MVTEWDDVRRQFRYLVLRRDRSIDEVARDVSLGRSTVYRLMQEAYEPRPAVRSCVERFVASQKERSHSAAGEG